MSTAKKPIILIALLGTTNQIEGEVTQDIAKRFSEHLNWETKVIQDIDGVKLKQVFAKEGNRVCIFHLVGNVEEGKKFFTENEGNWLDALATLKNLQLGFLSGCGSLSLVQTLLKSGANSVIATQEIQSQKATARFAYVCYTLLTGSTSLLHAFEKTADFVAKKYELGYTPSTRFSHELSHSPDSPFQWGLYVNADSQKILSWKLLPYLSAPFSPSKPSSSLKPVRPHKNKSRAPRKKSPSSTVFKNAVKRNPGRTAPIRPSKSRKPRIPSSSGSTLISAKLKKALADSSKKGQIEKLGKRWKALQQAKRERKLLEQVITRALPQLTWTPDRIDQKLAIPIEEELFSLNKKVIETELAALVNSQAGLSRGLLVKQKFSKKDVGKYHALIIGINEYEDPEINSLNRALHDAQALHKLLSEKYFFDHLQLLENPNRDEIVDAFDELDALTASGDNVLIFYAGHGKWDEESQIGYWLPKDAHHNKRRNWIENSTIHNAIKRLNPCQHVLLISDSCFSGALLDTRNVTGPAIQKEDKDIQILYQAKSRQILTSGAKEPVPDDSSFFKSLLETLQELPDKKFSTQTLFYKVRTEVLNDLRVGQNPQVGKILHAGDDGGDFVFFRR